MVIDQLRQGLRSLRIAPWYSSTVIGIVALGVMLTATVFAIVDGVLFKPLPYPQVERLFLLSGVNGGYVASLKEVEQWAAAVPEATFAVYQPTFELGAIGERPMPVYAAGIGPRFFEVARISPIIGGFTAADFEPTAGPSPALISYGLWQRNFGGRVDIVGARLDVIAPVSQLGVSLPGVRVAGVLPADFVYPIPRAVPDVILPIALTPEHAASRNWSLAGALVRLPPGLSGEALQARVNAIITSQGFPPPGRGFTSGVEGGFLEPRLRSIQTSSFRIAFGTALALMVLVCLSVAGLGVARRHQRRGEFAVRLALGAGRWHLLMLSLCEVLPLVVTGTVGGVLVAPFLLHGVVPWLPAGLGLLKTPEVDWRVVALATLTSAVAAAIASLAEFRALPDRALTVGIGRGQVITPRRGRFSAMLVATHVAMASVLVVAGMLLLASLWLVWQEDPGYRADRTVLFDFSPGGGSGADPLARVGDFIERCRRLPGVERVGAIGAKFLHSSYLSPAIVPPAGAQRVNVQSIPVAGDVFEILELQAIEGRLPTDDELKTGADVVVLSERVAKAYWPGRSAVGQTLASAQPGRRLMVIGVVRDARYGSLESTSYGQVYRPYFAFPFSSLLVRTHSTSDTLRAVTTAGAEVGGGFGITRAVTLTQALGESIGLRVFRAWLFGGFAVVALVITAVGILGVIAMSSSRRTRELGIRVALGASRAAVVRLILREQVLAVVAGLAAGGVTATWAVRFVRTFLYRFTVYDVRLWALAGAALVLTALVGALIPAIRASRVDPIQSLRVE